MKQITNYYHLAIKRNAGPNATLKSIRRDVWAEWYHLASSDEQPIHGLCPAGKESWCKFRSAEANKEPYHHGKHFHIPLVVMEVIKPIFINLSEPHLLRKCLHGKTQTRTSL